MKWRYQLALWALRTKIKILSSVSKSAAAKSAFDLFCTPMVRTKSSLPPVFTKAEHLSLHWQSYRLRGFRWNKGGSKKALIIHGFQSSCTNFHAYAEALMEHGYEVVAVDAPAHGGSSGTKINLIIYKDLILYLQQTFGPFDAAMAHSFGGLALTLALEEWPSTPLPKIALIAPASETSTAITQFFDSMQIKDPKVVAGFYQIIHQLYQKPADWYSVKRVLPKLNTPVLWIHDEDDTITPIADAEKIWALSIPQLRIVRTKGLGHRQVYKNPASVSEVMNHFTSTTSL